MARFNSEAVRCDGVDDKVSLTAMMGGLGNSDFLFSLNKNPPGTMAELMVKAQKYINAEEAKMARAESQHQPNTHDVKKRKEPENQNNNHTRPPQHDRPLYSNRGRNLIFEPRQQFRNFTPLTTTRDKILMQIQTYPDLKWPKPTTTPLGRKDQTKYCHFHRDHGHDTINCFQLKNQIEELIRGGRLTRFIKPKEDQPNQRNPDLDRPPAQNMLPHQRNPIGEIRVISGGLGGGGDSSGSRKLHARSAMASGMICTLDRPHKILKSSPTITFTEKDALGIQHPHDDPLVISAVIANYNIHRILIDNGSSADVIFLATFDKLGIEKAKLSPVRSPLSGFAGDRILPLGAIQLPLTLGTDPVQATHMVDFLVVDCPSTYNAILGRGTLNKFRAVTSTYHLIIRFPVGDLVGEVKGDQTTARECYAASLKSPKIKQTMMIDTLEVRDEEELQMGESAEPLYEVNIDSSDLAKVIKIGSCLDNNTKLKYQDFFKEFKDVFAWTHSDMQGISTSITAHCLNIDPRYRPIRQKQRTFAPERNQAIAAEVTKLMAAGFISEVTYPDWLSNVVLVKKSNGKWRMCVDFTDLNKACPKDSYPLPRIDLLVDSTAGYEMLSFMDAFSGYNQILMNETDQQHTSFITDRGLYCYKVMPFGLKNAGATYQRLVNAMFQNQVGRNVEVYVDDMLVKSKQASDHLMDLRETFSALRKYGMKLNPEKCAFGVGSGKFLGYMVSRRGIEANPEKIQAILDMQPPKGIKEVQRLTGRIVALNRFISRATDKCLPFFKTLKKSFN